MPRKAFYHRPTLTYPGSYVAWSRSLGCDSVIINGHAPAASIATLVTEARTAPALKVFVWAGPQYWRPDTWAATLTLLQGQVTTHRMDGLIADVEDWTSPRNDFRPWQQATTAEKQQLVQRLASAAETTSVGFTSFPAHAMVEQVARSSRRIWGSPQLYGLRTTTIAQLQQQRVRWAGLFSQITVSLAAWDRDAAEQTTYLRNWANEAGALFWVANALSNQPLFNSLRDWNPAGYTPPTGAGAAPAAPGAAATGAGAAAPTAPNAPPPAAPNAQAASTGAGTIANNRQATAPSAPVATAPISKGATPPARK